MRILIVLAAVTLMLGAQPAKRYTAKIVKSYPHDTNAFTQGLEFHGGTLYESTGLPGQSGIRRVDLETGKASPLLRLPAPYFGEGITILNGQMVQLTWQHQVGFVYQFPEIKLLKQFQYPGEGWGLTNDGKQIYMSDGTAQIRVLDPATMKEVRRITVQDGGRYVTALNELEWVKGEIYANVWQSDEIVRINPLNGKVTGWIDASALPRDRATTDVLNGIAYDAKRDKLIVTGKLWSKVYEITLAPK